MDKKVVYKKTPVKIHGNNSCEWIEVEIKTRLNCHWLLKMKNEFDKI